MATETVPIGPFQKWLAEKVDRYGMFYISNRIGTSEKTLRRILDGVSRATVGRGSNKKTVDREIKQLDLDFVDRAFIEFGTYLWEHYEHLYDFTKDLKSA